MSLSLPHFHWPSHRVPHMRALTCEPHSCILMHTTTGMPMYMSRGFLLNLALVVFCSCDEKGLKGFRTRGDREGNN
eukprot:1343269-Amorphochlora_amoeboformis.AAC.1